MTRAFAFVVVVVILAILLHSTSSLPPSPYPSPSSSPLAPGPTIHVFLVAGQSNSVGFNVDPFTPEDHSDPRILQLSCCASSKPLPPSQCYLNISADPLMPCSGAHVSFVMSFARALLPLLHPQDLIVVVPTGISGTGFADNVWTAYTGTGFVPAVAMLRRAWQLVGEGAYSSYNRRWAGVLWHQGRPPPTPHTPLTLACLMSHKLTRCSAVCGVRCMRWCEQASTTRVTTGRAMWPTPRTISSTTSAR